MTAMFEKFPHLPVLSAIALIKRKLLVNELMIWLYANVLCYERAVLNIHFVYC
jgi:hypothetical protein